MADFKVGDVVVCVDGSPCRRAPYVGAPFSFKEGQIGRISRIHMTDIGLGLEFPGHPGKMGVGLHESRFRHLPKSDEQFTEQMRALKPRKESIHA